MKDMQEGTGKVRWRKFAALAVPGVAAVGLMVFGMGQGAFAASFAVSGGQFVVTADKLHGDGFAQYGTIDGEANKSGPDAKPDFSKAHPVAVSAIKDAKLYNLCQSVVQKTPLGPVTLVIRAGKDANNPATAHNIFIDSSQLSGNATFHGIEIGRDAASLDKGAGAGQLGAFGQQATSVDITDLHQTAWATNAETFTLNGLDLSVEWGDHTCN